MTKILILADTLEPVGGTECALLGIANELASIPSISVRACVRQSDPEFLHESIDVTHYSPAARLPVLWRIRSLYAVQEHIRQYASFDFSDIDFCFTSKIAAAIAFRKLYPNIPLFLHTGHVIASRHHLDEKRSPYRLRHRLNAFVLDRLERRLYSRSLCCHLVSTKMVARRREEYFHLPKGFFEVQPLGFEPDHTASEESQEEVRASLGIPANAFVLTTVARLVPWKQVDMVIRTLSERPLSQTFLIIVGDGPERSHLRKLAEDLQVQDRVRFVGHVNRPGRYYVASDVFVLPSSLESFGLVYAEAMASGLPCIGLKHDPPRILSSAEDVIPEDRVGYCISDFPELVGRISQLSEDLDLRTRLSREAVRHAHAEFTYQRYARELLCLAQARFGIVEESVANDLEQPAASLDEETN